MEWFRAFERDGKELAELAKTPLTMPMLVLSGEKAGGEFLIQQGRLVDNNVEGVVVRSEEHTSELQSQSNLVCRLLLEKKKKNENIAVHPNQPDPRRCRRVRENRDFRVLRC